MTDAIAVFPPGFRVTDDETGAPVSGAKLKFYAAGTTTPRVVYSTSDLSTTSLGSTVYTDSLGAPVANQGSNTEVIVYTGTAAYKLVITDSDDNTIMSLDNIKGALDTSTFLTTGSTSTLTQPVITKTADYTIVAADRSKLIQGNTTGGQFTLTLTAAATLGDNWSCKFRNSGTANQFLLVASQAIAFEGGSFTARAFQPGEAGEIICDGTGFKLVGYTPPLMASRAPAVIAIVSRVSSAPSATAGARYIVSAGFSSYSTGDIIEANGASFNKYTPAADCGWLAFVQDENAYYSFQDSAWVAITLPATSTVQGLVKVSTQAIMETATATDAAVLVGHQKFHPAHPKAFGRFNSSGTLLGTNFSITSVTRNSAGNYTVVLSIAMADTNYGVMATCQLTNKVAYVSAITNTTTFTLQSVDSGFSAADSGISFSVYGDI